MNAERLHALLRSVKRELKDGESPSLLTNLVDALERIVQQPNQAEHQQNASRFRTELRQVLSEAPSNDFSPGWRQHLEELGISHLLGEELRDAVEEILASNEITPAAAAEELAPFKEQVSGLQQAIDQVTTGLDALNVGYEELDPGGYEVGVLIPRHAVDDELASLGREFIELERLLQPLVELATGSRPPLHLRAIGSSDFTAFLDAVPAVAACLTVAVERVLAIYKRVLEIRYHHNQLSEQQVPAEALESVRDHVDAVMSEELEHLADQLQEQFGGLSDDLARSNELRVDLLRALHGLAHRIDNGYSVEVRHEPLPEPEDDETEADDGEEVDSSAERRYSDMVLQRLEALRFMQVEGPPILSLRDGDDDSGDGE